MTSALQRFFAGTAVMIVLLALGWGLYLVGSPMSERLRKFDDRRLEDFRVIQNEIHGIVYGNEWNRPAPIEPVRPLPASLDEVVELAQNQRPSIHDPETGEPYEYSVQSTTTYQLCADFNFARDIAYDLLWNHPAGRACFTIDVTGQEGVKTVPRSPPAVPVPLD